MPPASHRQRRLLARLRSSGLERHPLAGPILAHAWQGEDDFWRWLGYTHVGPLLFGFIDWLDRTAADRGCSRLYFLARDGHLMQRTHALFAQQGRARLPGQYLLASRRACNLAALTDIDEAACHFLASGSSRIGVGDYLERVGLDPGAHAAAIHAAGFADAAQIVTGKADRQRLHVLFDLLAKPLLARAAEERTLITEYLNNQGLPAEPRPAIVDIGWHGSMQLALQRLLALSGHRQALDGFYLGTFAAAGQLTRDGLHQQGYLCTGGEPVGMYRAIRLSVELFEWIFCAPHGSLLHFERGEQGPEPVFAPLDAERARHASAAIMQDAALAFVGDALSLGDLPPLAPAVAVGMFAGLLRHPAAEEARLLGDLPHAEGFGAEARPRPIARPPKGLAGLLPALRRSFWRRGFVRRLLPGGRRD